MNKAEEPLSNKAKILQAAIDLFSEKGGKPPKKLKNSLSYQKLAWYNTMLTYFLRHPLSWRHKTIRR